MDDHGHPRRQQSQQDDKHYEKRKVDDLNMNGPGWLQIRPSALPPGPGYAGSVGVEWELEVQRKAVLRRGRHRGIVTGRRQRGARVIAPLFTNGRDLSSRIRRCETDSIHCALTMSEASQSGPCNNRLGIVQSDASFFFSFTTKTTNSKTRGRSPPTTTTNCGGRDPRSSCRRR
jgi:hypothetical protein